MLTRRLLLGALRLPCALSTGAKRLPWEDPKDPPRELHLSRHAGPTSRSRCRALRLRRRICIWKVRRAGALSEWPVRLEQILSRASWEGMETPGNGLATPTSQVNTKSTQVARFDASDFSSPSVDFVDLPAVPRQQVRRVPSRAEPDLRGFVDGFSLGNYAFLVPNFNGIRHGKLVRIDMRDFGAYARHQREQPDGEPLQVRDARYSRTITSTGTQGDDALQPLITGNDGVQFVDLSLHDPRDVGFSGGFPIV
eukprot:scaffold1187_cov258-Pinguiococcus_pyrenoidosus.AAC.14